MTTQDNLQELIERLKNPQFNIYPAHGSGVVSIATDQNVADMKLAADAVSRLQDERADMLAALEKIADKEGSFAFVRNAHAGMSQIARAAISRALGTEHDAQTYGGAA